MNEDAAELNLSVSDFVGLLNQTLEFAYPGVNVTGELANFRVSKNRWVYFDLKDEFSSVKCFGTVYMLPGPLEDGMVLEVRAQPRLHNLYGFSLNIMSLRPAGEGSIRKAADLLAAKLSAEGLFDEERKRALPYPPQKIGLITSSESAAYADFIKILNARWGSVDIELIDVQVQGEPAAPQIIAAIERFNAAAEPPDVLVITRGGGSAEDLQAFSHETLTRAVAASRVPTLVAIGHEVDISLAELAADVRASTPSNAAELLTPDRREVLQGLRVLRGQLHDIVTERIAVQRHDLTLAWEDLDGLIAQLTRAERQRLQIARQLLEILSPQAVLRRGYAVVRTSGGVVRRARGLTVDDTIELEFSDGRTTAVVRKGKA